MLGAHDAFFQDLMADLERKGLTSDAPGNRLRFRSFSPALSPEEEGVRAQIVADLKGSPFTPPSPEEIAAGLRRPAKEVSDLVSLLEEEGEVVKLTEDVFFHREALEAAKEKLRAHLAVHKAMTASDARSVLGTTRKYAIPLLEQLDREGFTLRKGDLRELRPGSAGRSGTDA